MAFSLLLLLAPAFAIAIDLNANATEPPVPLSPAHLVLRFRHNVSDLGSVSLVIDDVLIFPDTPAGLYGAPEYVQLMAKPQDVILVVFNNSGTPAFNAFPLPPLAAYTVEFTRKHGEFVVGLTVDKAFSAVRIFNAFFPSFITLASNSSLAFDPLPFNSLANAIIIPSQTLALVATSNATSPPPRASLVITLAPQTLVTVLALGVTNDSSYPLALSAAVDNPLPCPFRFASIRFVHAMPYGGGPLDLLFDDVVAASNVSEGSFASPSAVCVPDGTFDLAVAPPYSAARVVLFPQLQVFEASTNFIALTTANGRNGTDARPGVAIEFVELFAAVRLIAPTEGGVSKPLRLLTKSGQLVGSNVGASSSLTFAPLGDLVLENLDVSDGGGGVTKSMNAFFAGPMVLEVDPTLSLSVNFGDGCIYSLFIFTSNSKSLPLLVINFCYVYPTLTNGFYLDGIKSFGALNGDVFWGGLPFMSSFALKVPTPSAQVMSVAFVAAGSNSLTNEVLFSMLTGTPFLVVNTANSTVSARPPQSLPPPLNSTLVFANAAPNTPPLTISDANGAILARDVPYGDSAALALKSSGTYYFNTTAGAILAWNIEAMQGVLSFGALTKSGTQFYFRQQNASGAASVAAFGAYPAPSAAVIKVNRTFGWAVTFGQRGDGLTLPAGLLAIEVTQPSQFGRNVDVAAGAQVVVVVGGGGVVAGVDVANNCAGGGQSKVAVAIAAALPAGRTLFVNERGGMAVVQGSVATFCVASGAALTVRINRGVEDTSISAVVTAPPLDGATLVVVAGNEQGYPLTMFLATAGDISITSFETSPPNVGAIVGGVLGGSAFVALVVGGVALRRRRKRRNAELEEALTAAASPTSRSEFE